MSYGLIIFGVTVFLIYNTYHDGIYLKKLYSYKKYYTMIMYGFIGLCVYLFIKKHPNDSSSMFVYANNMIKYMPIDKESMDIMSPLLDFTSKNMSSNLNNQQMNPQFKRMMNSGQNNVFKQQATKRSVSETKKKYIASQQNWKCAKCSVQLPAWFEVDHKIRLEHGGSNHISNLVAYCRDCHGEKTALESM
jgi:hypothetical protein